MEAFETVSEPEERENRLTEVVTVQQKRGRKSRWTRRRVGIFLVVSLVNVGVLLLLASQLLVPAQQGPGGSSSPLIGHPAPDFTLSLLGTHAMPPIHLAQLRGTPLMLNFWASWCDVCKLEAPLLENTWQRMQGQHQKVLFLGIDYDDIQQDGLGFVQQYGITYPNVIDPSGTTTINYGVSGVPETFFINRDGVIVQKVVGELTEQVVQENLQALFRSV